MVPRKVDPAVADYTYYEEPRNASVKPHQNDDWGRNIAADKGCETKMHMRMRTQTDMPTLTKTSKS